MSSLFNLIIYLYQLLSGADTLPFIYTHNMMSATLHHTCYRAVKNPLLLDMHCSISASVDSVRRGKKSHIPLRFDPLARHSPKPMKRAVSEQLPLV